MLSAVYGSLEHQVCLLADAVCRSVVINDPERARCWIDR